MQNVLTSKDFFYAIQTQRKLIVFFKQIKVKFTFKKEKENNFYIIKGRQQLMKKKKTFTFTNIVMSLNLKMFLKCHKTEIQKCNFLK